MSDSLWPHGLKHTRPRCPSPSPRVCPSSCSLHWWCHPAISFSEALFSFCLQSFPASGTFPVSQFFTLGDQSIGVSASASVLPMNIWDWFPLVLTGYISSQSLTATNWKPQDWLLIRQNFSFARELTVKHPLGAFSSLGLKNAKAHFLVICLHTK